MAGRCWMEEGNMEWSKPCRPETRLSLLTRAAIRPKPEMGGRGWPHVIPVGFGDLEASGGWSGKWGKGQSVAPAVASLQGRWAEVASGQLGQTPTGQPWAGCQPPWGGHATSRRSGLHLLCWRAGGRRPWGCCCV